MIKEKFERKIKDYVDASMFLAYLFDESDECRDYIRTIGYKKHDIGIITAFVMGEILTNILLKKETIQTRKDIFDVLGDTFDTLLSEERLKILKFKKKHIDLDIFNEIRKIDWLNDDTDALHLVFAIQADCRFFVTTDKGLFENKRLKEYLKQNFNLRIKYFISQT